MIDNVVESTLKRARLTQKQKNANDFKWYKERADLLDNHSSSDISFVGFGGISEYTRKKVNYELFNNNLYDIKELAYVCKPFGDDLGELPAKMTNIDIVSPKIKVLLGMEMSMPFSHRVIAVNEEATTRKEQQEFGMIQDFVVAEIMKPIRQQLEQQALAQTQGRELTREEQQQIQANVEQELQAKTPEEVKKYMVREHQDPAEVLMTQILEYLVQEERTSEKFNQVFKHGMLSGEMLYHVGIFNGKPKLTVVNPMGYTCDRSEGLEGVEDGQWGTMEYFWTPNEVISKLGSELTEEQIDRVYNYEEGRGSSIRDSDFSFDLNARPQDGYTVRVVHNTWKALMKIGFLTYNSPITGKEELMLVDENYKLNEIYGDIDIQWEWIPETHEVWKILDDIYVHCRPVPGQHKDIDNLWEAKLPYIGAFIDATNSTPTAPMDRIKNYQYYYDIIHYRIQMLMASDKGKILMMNIKALPKSAKIDINKFIYYMEANKLGFLNPNEEGNRGNGGDITNIVKEIDMSLASDIQRYITLAEYIETKCGAAIGVTKAMEGAIGPTDAVTNTKQNLIQASHIVKPYFDLHNTVKGRVLTALVETAKFAYSENPPGTLSYVLDDMSVRMINMGKENQSLLQGSRYGLYIANSVRAEEAKQAIINLAQAGLQNDQIDLLDVFKIIKTNNLNEAEEQLTVGREIKREQLQQVQQEKLAADKEGQTQQMAFTRETWKHESDMIILKAKEERKTKLQVEAMAAMGFDPNKDEDGDGMVDILEVYKLGTDAEIQKRKEDREDDKFEHQKDVDKQKLENDKEKIKVQKIKKNSSQ